MIVISWIIITLFTLMVIAIPYSWIIEIINDSKRTKILSDGETDAWRNYR